MDHDIDRAEIPMDEPPSFQKGNDGLELIVNKIFLLKNQSSAGCEVYPSRMSTRWLRKIFHNKSIHPDLRLFRPANQFRRIVRGVESSVHIDTIRA